MKTRLIIILFSVPLFIALALMNGALLYFQERSEAESALNELALSAAVTAAEFTASTQAAERIFDDPSRLGSITAAARHIKDLDGFYFIDENGEATALSPAANQWSLDGLSRPSEPTAISAITGAGADPYIVALAPAGPASFVAVRLDAAPMLARLDTMRQDILLISCLAGIIGALLAWQVAHRIVGDLHQNQRAIAALDAGEDITAGKGFRIREASDLADAVRLMNASQCAAAKRLDLENLRRDRGRSPENSAAIYSQSILKPLSMHAAGAQIAIRLMGDASPGSFFIVCANTDKAVIVAGECAAKLPADALALALAARRFLESHLLDGDVDKQLALAKAAYGVTALEHAEWRAKDTSAPSLGLLALTDADTRRGAECFSATDPGATPVEVLDGIEALLKPTGVFAVIKTNSFNAQMPHAGENEHDQT